MLTEVEREHLFLLGLGRPPEVRFHAIEGMSPRLQRVLDSLKFSPAVVKTSTWDVVAWNRAAAVALKDYESLPLEQRNILRLMFLDPQVRAAQPDWDSVARFVVAAFRADAVRAGASRNVQALVDELSRRSPEFDAMWRSNDVRSYGEGTKFIRHPVAGLIGLEYSAFAVDGRLDLSLVIYTPTTPADVDKIRSLIEKLHRARGEAAPTSSSGEARAPGRSINGLNLLVSATLIWTMTSGLTRCCQRLQAQSVSRVPSSADSGATTTR
jgi:hypothetical protein